MRAIVEDGMSAFHGIMLSVVTGVTLWVLVLYVVLR
jgi:hypothetical protein